MFCKRPSPRHIDRLAKHGGAVFLSYRAMDKKKGGKKISQFLLTVLVFKLQEFQVTDTR